eukprot:Colp12_sorted_trinity150504_noHs@18990
MTRPYKVFDEDEEDKFSCRKLLSFMGPGFMVAIAYIDPGNLLADIVAGAAFNYRLIWVLIMASLLGLLTQMLSSKLGTVTGCTLSRLCRAEYGTNTPVTITLWLITEAAIIASDIPEVVGSAFALQLLFDIPLWAGVLITSTFTFLLLGMQYYSVRLLEGFISLLVAMISICFIAEAILSPVQWSIPDCASDDVWFETIGCEKGTNDCPDNYCGSVWGGLIPRISSEQFFIATSLIGAVVMPHNLYLHSGLVQSRHIDRQSFVQVKWANIYNAIECTAGLVVSCFINIAVVIVAASVFFPNPFNKHRVVEDIEDIGFLQSKDLLDHTLGRVSGVLFSVALLASGASSTITGTYAGQFVMEGFLKLKMVLWKRNLITRSVAIVPSLIICVSAGARGANMLIVISSVVLSFQLPFALIPLLKFTSSEGRMGPFKNSRLMTFTCVILATLVILANLYLIVSKIFLSEMDTGLRIVSIVLGVLVGLAY